LGEDEPESLPSDPTDQWEKMSKEELTMSKRVFLEARKIEVFRIACDNELKQHKE
jgi:hypothetical protein